MTRRSAALLTLLGLVACGDETRSGVDEPLYVERAVFRPGPLPGRLPSAGEPDADAGPLVTALELTGAIFHPGQQHRRIAGRVSAESYAIGIQLAEQGTGWWVRPVDGPDVLANGELTFELFVSLGDVEPGLHQLRLVAIDADGEAGLQRDLSVCIAAPIPDNFNSCDPTIKPPAVLVSLRWDSPVDLDLVLAGPGGEVLDARRPFGVSAVGALSADALRDPTIPRFVRDSNAGCTLDGRQREDVIFPELPDRGAWLIQARFFEACGAPSALAVAEVYRRREQADGTWQLIKVAEAGAHFVALQADGGISPPTYLLPLSFP